MILQLSEGLARRGHNVRVLAPGRLEPKWKNVQAARMHLLDERSFGVDFNLLEQLFFDRFPIVSRLRILDPTRIRLRWTRLRKGIPDADANIATFCFTAFAVTGLSRPFYYVQHFEPLFWPNEKDRYIRGCALSTYRLPIRQLAVSRWIKTLLSEKFGTNPVLVGNGIDLSVFRPRPKGLIEQSGNRVICAFFRGIEWKGDAELLEAVHRVHRDCKNITLALVGSPENLSEGLRRHSNLIDYPITRFSGLSDEQLAGFYSCADLFVSASWYEGFGLPPLEAMACGTPVVMTDSLGSRDYTAHLKNAYVVQPRDPIALAQGIKRVLTDESLRARLREKGLETARNFDFARVIPRVESALADDV